MNKYIVRFFDKIDGRWYNINDIAVSKDQAEEVYNNQTYNGQIYTKPNENLLFQIKEVFIQS